MMPSGKGRHVRDFTASLLTVQLTDGSGAVIGNKNKQKIKESGIKSGSWTGRFYSALSYEVLRGYSYLELPLKS